MKFRWTMEELKSMSDDEILKRLIIERKSTLDPNAPLSRGLSKIELRLDEKIKSKTLLYKTDASYESENPFNLRFEVHKAGDQGIYNEIAVDCFNAENENVGSVYIGLCMDKKDIRVLMTLDGEGDGDHKLAVYPMRDEKEAVESNLF